MVAESVRGFEGNPSPASREAHKLYRSVDISPRGKLYAIQVVIAACRENLTLLLRWP